jgi:hypothetical protein
MASKILKNIIKVSSNILLAAIFYNSCNACVCSEEPEIYRIAMFRAEIEGMSSFSQFYYSANYLPAFFSNPQSNDRRLNCMEWKKELGNKSTFYDIYAILYKVPADMFVYAFNEDLLPDVFEDNTFIEELLLPENKNLLNYLLLAKMAEYHENHDSDPWGTGNTFFENFFTNTLIDKFSSALPKEKSKFLQRRYAYQLSRLFCENGDYKKCINLYDNYFKDQVDSTIIEPWTLLYKALALDEIGNKTEANYLYSQVFSRSDEKKLRCYLGFNTGRDIYRKTLAMADSDKEKVPVIALSCFHDPGPALVKLKEIYSIDPNSSFLAPLIMREVNKLEDWIVTPALTSESSSVPYDTSYSSAYYKSEEEWQKAKQKNLEKDKQYLRKFIDFLAVLYAPSKDELHDYLAAAIAHLYLLDDKPGISSVYIAAISKDAPKSVLFQKYVDGLLISISSNNMENETVKENIGQQLAYLQKAAADNFTVFKTLYSVVLKLNSKYEKLGDFAMAGLLKNKSDYLKYCYESQSEYGYLYGYFLDNQSYSYQYIAYFDEKAGPSDMDSVLRIITKPRNSLDSFACAQKLGDTYTYMDLKGTLAFRMDSLQLAYKTFSQIPDSFYENEYEFKNYLNEDPFIPKCWPHERNFNYNFSKAKFVKQLIALKNDAASHTENAAQDYLELGNAYYNCSYWGNSWMMFAYGWSVYPSDFNDWELYPANDFSSNTNNLETYYECSRAVDYYVKAMQASAEREVNAEALFMMYACDYSSYYYLGKGYSWDAPADLMQKFSSLYMKELCIKYNNTKTFNELSSNCSTIYDYAVSLGVR